MDQKLQLLCVQSIETKISSTKATYFQLQLSSVEAVDLYDPDYNITLFEADSKRYFLNIFSNFGYCMLWYYVDVNEKDLKTSQYNKRYGMCGNYIEKPGLDIKKFISNFAAQKKG